MTASVLLEILDNQQRRTEAAFEDLPASMLAAAPGGDCRPIADIGLHLIALRRFLLLILESPRADEIDVEPAPSSVDELLVRLSNATDAVRDAVATYDEDAWRAPPTTPRPGKWGDEPTLVRFCRPLNDYVSHLGSIRAIRRVAGCGAARTQ